MIAPAQSGILRVIPYAAQHEVMRCRYGISNSNNRCWDEIPCLHGSISCCHAHGMTVGWVTVGRMTVGRVTGAWVTVDWVTGAWVTGAWVTVDWMAYCRQKGH